MRLIPQRHLIEYITPNPLAAIESAGRTCWRSEDRTGPDTAERFVRMVMKKGHHALLEFCDMRVRCVTNRGVSHELVRHRIASYAQQSTRYVGEVDGQMELIRPDWLTDEMEAEEFGLGKMYMDLMDIIESAYDSMIGNGLGRDQARGILPNDLATEIVIKANFREWRTIFELRAVGTTGKPHPQMQALMGGILMDAASRVPFVFNDLRDDYLDITDPAALAHISPGLLERIIAENADEEAQ
jgi:thymidylate synthase (FAD)